MFIHLHHHSSYSFLDGYNPIERMVARVKELGMTATAITDHNHLGGIPWFQEECEKQGIKPLLGMEGYFTPDMNEASKNLDERRETALESAIDAGAITEEEASKMKKADLNKAIAPYMYDMHQYHILFIAKNQTGWHNLVKIQSEAARRCTYNGRYLCDMDLLIDYHEGIICTTACVGSYPAKMIEKGDYDAAEDYIMAMKEIFGEDFYLEIQPLDISQQHAVNLFYKEMAEKYDIQVVATNDVHYTLKEDFEDHDTLLCIGTGKKKSDTDRMRYSHDFWIKSEEEMYDSFSLQASSMDLGQEYKDFYTKAIENTQAVADKVDANIKLGSDTPLFSNVQVPNGFTPGSYLEYLSWKGLYAYLKAHPECNRRQYEERLRQELDIIVPKGFAPYMLAVHEYINWANANGVPTGPGRGSAAGSLCLFSIGVTKNIDPIKERLLFSRFLTADRRDPPDIDTDFLYAGRDKVIQHLEDYYGSECVAHIGTYSEMGVKSGLKDVCRVLEIPFGESNNITKTIDEVNNAPGIKFKDLDAMKDGDENEQKAWEKFNQLENRYPEVFRLARAFEGTPRNQGVHASGILVTPCPVTDVAPVRYKDGVAITLYTGPQLEHFNFIKYDFLGLKTLDIIQKTLNAIPSISDFDDLYRQADIEDKKVWKYIADKNTDGVFQVESGMMKGIIDRIQPTCFADLGAICAIGRPGPISIGLDKKYADVKNGKEEMTYPIRGCEDILDETFGNPVYQEQLMFISKKISGFDDMQADSITRKVLGKKKVEMFPMMKRCHVFGKKNCEGPEGWETDDNAPWYDPKGKYGKEIPGALVNGYTKEEVLDYFDKIEGFAKYCFNRAHSSCYAYIGFLTAWLKYYYPTEFMAAVLSMQDTPEDIKFYSEVCKKMDIKITVPNINISKEDFTANAYNRTILYGLSAIKGVGGAALGELIANAPYESLENAIARLPKKAFNKRVAEGLIKAGAFDWEDDNRINLLNRLHEIRRDRVSMDDGTKVIDYEAPDRWNENRCMAMEEETLGTHITYHNWWEDLDDGEKATFTGRIKSVREHRQKNGKLMAFVTLTDERIDTDIDCCVFAKQYGPLNSLLFGREGHVLRVNGKKSDKGSFIINDVQPVIKPINKMDEPEYAVDL